MANQLNRSVLVLDDDNIFRSLVADLLASRGLTVVEARSAKEADAIVAAGNPALAIVDYRLPHVDGLTWITRIREAGRKFPIVFLSGCPCDERTFNWLRNILGVSLILRKPIVPESFFDQVASVLGEEFCYEISRSIMPACEPVEEDSQLATDSLEEQAAWKEQDSNTAASVWHTMRDENQDDPLASIRKDYLDHVTEAWRELDVALGLVQQEPYSSQLRQNVIERAHKIRGTAGSLGFIQIGEAAGLIEDFLCAVDSSDRVTEQAWSKICLAFSSGETSLIENIEQIGAAGQQVTLGGNKVYALA